MAVLFHCQNRQMPKRVRAVKKQTGTSSAGCFYDYVTGHTYLCGCSCICTIVATNPPGLYILQPTAQHCAGITLNHSCEAVITVVHFFQKGESQGQGQKGGQSLRPHESRRGKCVSLDFKHYDFNTGQVSSLLAQCCEGCGR